MTREEAITVLKVFMENPLFSDDHKQAFNMAIKALEQELCGKDINVPATDAISRQAAIDACLNGWNKDYKEIVEEIRTLPPVQPKQKTGHWIPSHVPESILDECSECGFSCGAFTFNYCPNCGAKMVEPQESEEECKISSRDYLDATYPQTWEV